MNEKTIFEKIIAREIPADIISEDEVSILMLDINPNKKGHVLLISKTPYPWMQDAPDEIVSKMFIHAKKIMGLLKKQLGCDYVQVVVEGIQVPHFHIHLIPSYLNKKNADWHHEQYENELERQSYIEKIKSVL